MIRFLSKDILRNLPEVKSSAFLVNKKRRFHKEGLFSEVIFGPVYSYRCSCGKYYGKPIEEDPEAICKVCGVNYTYSSLKRRRQHARIHLPIPVINPVYFKFISKIFGESSSIIKTVKTLMTNEHAMLYWDKDKDNPDSDEEVLYFYTGPDDDPPSPQAKKMTLHEAIHYIIYDGCQEMLAIGLDQYQQILDTIEHLFIEDVLVYPPDFRPIVRKADSKNVDQVNEFYYSLLNKKELFSKTDINIDTDRSLYFTYYIQFQRVVNQLFDYVIDRLSKKEGVIRYNILGKRMDFSGRAVIAPDPTLKLDECVLPYKMVLEIFRLHIASHLTNLGGEFKFTNRALQLIDDCIVKDDPVLLPVCQKVVENELCLLNRQPTLHRLGMVGFKIKVRHVNVIYIHPLVCAGFNADFDGDSILSTITIKRANGEYITKHIADLKDSGLFEHKPEKEKENISYYEPNEKLFIEAINLENGKIEEKQITEYTEHRNLKMYQIHDPQNRFEDFWASDDHSLIVYDEKLDEYQKISPVELLKNPDGKYLVQKPQ